MMQMKINRATVMMRNSHPNLKTLHVRLMAVTIQVARKLLVKIFTSRSIPRKVSSLPVAKKKMMLVPLRKRAMI